MFFLIGRKCEITYKKILIRNNTEKSSYIIKQMLLWQTVCKFELLLEFLAPLIFNKLS